MKLPINLVGLFLHQMDLEAFPDLNMATEDGLLALGGNLSVERLIMAYREGIFPWYEEGQPIMWWSPDPRMLLYPKEIKISRSMRQLLDKDPYRYSMDTAFEEVMTNCRMVERNGQQGTWITQGMMHAYVALHQKGLAHSIEVWRNEALVGGLYGVALGRAFFGESMFHKEKNASKAGFIRFAKWALENKLELIDCQVPSAHLRSLGAREIPREKFIIEMKKAIRAPKIDHWHFQIK